MSAALDPQVGFRFRLVHPDGKTETMLVDSDRALIGSAAHCEVRLPPETVAHEHVELYVADKVIHWATRRMAIANEPVTLDGQPMTEGQWPLESTLAVGGVQMKVEIVPLGPPKAKPPYWALAAAIPMIGITMTAVALAHGPLKREAIIPDAPELLPPTSAAVCRNVSPDQRVGLAQETLRVALSKRERSPFVPSDGVEAVSGLENAAVCFRSANMPNEANEANEAARILRDRLQNDYRVHRVRLEHAFRIHDSAVAKRELNVLIPLTSHLRGPYTDWLGALDRAATADLASRGRIDVR